MPYVKHVAILITGLSTKIGEAFSKATELGFRPLGPADDGNMFQTIIVPPDSRSKHYGDDHDAHEQRGKLVKWLQAADDFDWIEVGYGGDFEIDNEGPAIMRHSWVGEGD